MQIRNWRLVKRVMVVILSLGLGIGGSPGMVAQALAQAGESAKCARELRLADQHYRRGAFDQAISLLTQCLNKPGLAEQEKLRAYRLLGLAYIAKDYLNEARSAIRKLLDLVPDYQPDPVQDPPPFTRLVQEVKQAKEKPAPRPAEKERLEKIIPAEKDRSTTVYWLAGGAGAVVLGVLAAVLIGGGPGEEKAQPLPGPPDLP
jgi:tetratricopeptide (TPR) repeat protein